MKKNIPINVLLAWRYLSTRQLPQHPKMQINKRNAQIPSQFSGTAGKNKRSDPPAMNAVILMRKFLRGGLWVWVAGH
jgi:hypothetical protein